MDFIRDYKINKGIEFWPQTLNLSSLYLQPKVVDKDSIPLSKRTSFLLPDNILL